MVSNCRDSSNSLPCSLRIRRLSNPFQLPYRLLLHGMLPLRLFRGNEATMRLEFHLGSKRLNSWLCRRRSSAPDIGRTRQEQACQDIWYSRTPTIGCSRRRWPRPCLHSRPQQCRWAPAPTRPQLQLVGRQRKRMYSIPHPTLSDHSEHTSRSRGRNRGSSCSAPSREPFRSSLCAARPSNGQQECPEGRRSLSLQ